MKLKYAWLHLTKKKNGKYQTFQLLDFQGQLSWKATFHTSCASPFLKLHLSLNLQKLLLFEF